MPSIAHILAEHKQHQCVAVKDPRHVPHMSNPYLDNSGISAAEINAKKSTKINSDYEQRVRMIEEEYNKRVRQANELLIRQR